MLSDARCGHSGSHLCAWTNATERIAPVSFISPIICYTAWALTCLTIRGFTNVYQTERWQLSLKMTTTDDSDTDQPQPGSALPLSLIPLSPFPRSPLTKSPAATMGHHTMRRLCLLIGSITFVVLILNRSNHDRVWGTPAYLEYMFEYAHQYPPKPPPHRKLQFGLLETVSTDHPGTPVRGPLPSSVPGLSSFFTCRTSKVDTHY